MARVADETRFEAQRHRILKAAATCFNQKGFSGTSLKDVSRQLGLTDAALYYTSRTKKNWFISVTCVQPNSGVKPWNGHQ